jgi:pimeloyl-ACP methyl ester carboxylesterase
MASLPNIVLVHGAWADGSCWSDVIAALQTEGYRVTSPQFPLTGLSDAPNVVGLVYIAAFGLDKGESLGALLSQGPVTPALVHQSVDDRGFVWLSEDDFTRHFAADVDIAKARVMFAVQQPLVASSFNDVIETPAWRSLPTWYLVATNDEAIPPEAERMFAQRMGAVVVEAPSSHVAMVSHAPEVVGLIKTAAAACSDAR